jgi:hypothetical protein
MQVLAKVEDPNSLIVLERVVGPLLILENEFTSFMV